MLYFVYILSSKKDGVLYIGMTNDLIRRVFEHREGTIDGFTKKYQVKNLIYYEEHSHPESAILREKQIKKWKRDWKIRLIEGDNPDWDDLYEKII